MNYLKNIQLKKKKKYVRIFSIFQNGGFKMLEIYKTLNSYLNDICVYLGQQDTFLLEKIDKISMLNDRVLEHIQNYDLSNNPVQNKLTYKEVFMLAREIIATIDSSYLSSFDALITSGELDFSFEANYTDSFCRTVWYEGRVIQKLINVNRVFNYKDVITLIHEFIHYVNAKKNTLNHHYFTEFFSIYFELYSNLYLLKKGIPKNEIDSLARIKSLKQISSRFYQYEIPLLAFEKIGNINENTVALLQEHFLDIKQELFDEHCTWFYKVLEQIKKKNEKKIDQNPGILGIVLSEEFIAKDYRYILGTILALYALKYADMKDIVFLNNHICEYESKAVHDICLMMKIDLKEKNFFEHLFSATDEYIKMINQNSEKDFSLMRKK